MLVKGEGGSSRKEGQLRQGTKKPGVFKYCIQGCQGRCHVQNKGKESGQEMKGCSGNSRGEGSSGEIQRNLDTCFVLMSQRLHEKKGYCLFWRMSCHRGHWDISDPWPNKTGKQHPEANHTRPQGSEVRGHTTGSLPVSPHNKGLQGQPLSFSL